MRPGHVVKRAYQFGISDTKIKFFACKLLYWLKFIFFIIYFYIYLSSVCSGQCSRWPVCFRDVSLGSDICCFFCLVQHCRKVLYRYTVWAAHSLSLHILHMKLLLKWCFSMLFFSVIFVEHLMGLFTSVELTWNTAVHFEVLWLCIIWMCCVRCLYLYTKI